DPPPRTAPPLAPGGCGDPRSPRDLPPSRALSGGRGGGPAAQRAGQAVLPVGAALCLPDAVAVAGRRDRAVPDPSDSAPGGDVPPAAAGARPVWLRRGASDLQP